MMQVQAVMERDEMAFDHSAAVRSLLERALAIADPSRPRRHRFKAIQHLKLADELSSAQVRSDAAVWQALEVLLPMISTSHSTCLAAAAHVVGLGALPPGAAAARRGAGRGLARDNRLHPAARQGMCHLARQAARPPRPQPQAAQVHGTSPSACLLPSSTHSR